MVCTFFYKLTVNADATTNPLLLPYYIEIKKEGIESLLSTSNVFTF